MKRTIVMVMAHADDIEWSAGATLARYIGRGYRALYGVLSRCNSGWIVTEAEGGHYVPSLTVIPRRRVEARAAAELFGADLFEGDLLENCYTTREGARVVPSYAGPAGIGEAVEQPDVGQDDVPRGSLFLAAAGAGDTWENHPEVIRLAGTLAEWQPELVVGQPVGNLNPDHFLAAQIAAIAWQMASRKAGIGPYWLPVMPARGGYVFPPLQPDRFVDVGGCEERCLAALACHVSQGGHLARTQQRRRASWGAWKERCGCASAEAFLQIYGGA